jgi:alcohol dehydrogenase
MRRKDSDARLRADSPVPVHAPSGADLEVLSGLVDDGRLRPVIDRVFPFEQIADAFAYLEQGHAKGKVVVQL